LLTIKILAKLLNNTSQVNILANITQSEIQNPLKTNLMKTVFIIFAFLPILSFGEYGDHTKGTVTKYLHPGAATLDTQSRKVLMHYMLWYGDSLSTGNEYLRHWNDGYCYTPLIGRYSSKSWSLLNYHVLLANSCGIDGLVANVLDAYDSVCFKRLMNAMRNMRNLDTTHFKFSFAICYDNQRYTSTDTLKLQRDLIYLRDSVFPLYKNYQRVNDTPAVFVYNYPGHLTAKQFKSALTNVFPGPRPKLCWNESQQEVVGYVDICYPWAQPYAQNWDTLHGLEWGKKYLLDFFWRINNIFPQNSLVLGCSGVWPGFNDTCNTSWGSNRWMDRRIGVVYDSTWIMSENYNSGTLPLKWVYIETYNDNNEGTELDPSIQYGNVYLDSTILKINRFKGTAITLNPNRYSAAKTLFDAGSLIERHQRDSLTCYPCYENAVRAFLINDFQGAVTWANKINTNQCGCGSSAIALQDISNALAVYPNPATIRITVKLNGRELTGIFQLSLINGDGTTIRQMNLNKSAQLDEFQIDIHGLPAGEYYIRVANEKNTGIQKVIIN